MMLSLLVSIVIPFLCLSCAVGFSLYLLYGTNFLKKKAVGFSLYLLYGTNFLKKKATSADDSAPVVEIINSSFCNPNPLDLNILPKSFLASLTFRRGDFDVTDANGKTVLKVKGSIFNVPRLWDCRVLLDAADCPIVTFQRSLATAHQRWKIFRGESTENTDLVFSVKMSSCFQLKTKLNVYLASNTNENVPNFKVELSFDQEKVEVSWLQGSCKADAGKSSTIIAKMEKKGYNNPLMATKDYFSVAVTPGVDYAFIVALIVILDQIRENNNSLNELLHSSLQTVLEWKKLLI